MTCSKSSGWEEVKLVLEKRQCGPDSVLSGTPLCCLSYRQCSQPMGRSGEHTKLRDHGPSIVSEKFDCGRSLFSHPVHSLNLWGTEVCFFFKVDCQTLHILWLDVKTFHDMVFFPTSSLSKPPESTVLFFYVVSQVGPQEETKFITLTDPGNRRHAMPHRHPRHSHLQKHRCWAGSRGTGVRGGPRPQWCYLVSAFLQKRQGRAEANSLEWAILNNHSRL